MADNSEMEKFKKILYVSTAVLVLAVILFLVLKIFFATLDWLIRIVGIAMLVFIALTVYSSVRSRK